MNRRKVDAVRGFVNFPVSDDRYTHTREGGMFVRIMVLMNDDWMHCCGGWTNVMYDECLIPGDSEWDFDKGNVSETEDHLFPLLNDERYHNDTGLEYLSRPCLATLTIGSTGWSGFDNEAGETWICTEDDLTVEGRELLASLRKLYEGCEVVLTTWLDT